MPAASSWPPVAHPGQRRQPSRRRSAGGGRGRSRSPARRRRVRYRTTAFGISTFTIMWICRLSPWPTPITAFLTAFGAYSATASPAQRRHQHGDAARLPELQRRRRILVDEGLLHRRLVRRLGSQDIAQARHAAGRAASRAPPCRRIAPCRPRRSAANCRASRRRPSRCASSPGSMPMMRIA